MSVHAQNTVSTIKHDYHDLMELFKETFFSDYNTLLIKGEDEPLYSPANQSCSYHQIIFAHGYFTSGLHEISHWCIAGKERRLLEDFGYWYQPDGRNVDEQKVFESVEIKPQAIEWAFSVATNLTFNVSADNLSGAPADTTAFKQKVYEQVCFYLDNGFPPRAQQFISALARFYHTSLPLTLESFILDKTMHSHV